MQLLRQARRHLRPGLLQLHFTEPSASDPAVICLRRRARYLCQTLLDAPFRFFLVTLPAPIPKFLCALDACAPSGASRNCSFPHTETELLRHPACLSLAAVQLAASSSSCVTRLWSPKWWSERLSTALLPKRHHLQKLEEWSQTHTQGWCNAATAVLHQPHRRPRLA